MPNYYNGEHKGRLLRRLKLDVGGSERYQLIDYGRVIANIEAHLVSNSAKNPPESDILLLVDVSEGPIKDIITVDHSTNHKEGNEWNFLNPRNFSWIRGECLGDGDTWSKIYISGTNDLLIDKI